MILKLGGVCVSYLAMMHMPEVLSLLVLPILYFFMRKGV